MMGAIFVVKTIDIVTIGWYWGQDITGILEQVPELSGCRGRAWKATPAANDGNGLAALSVWYHCNENNNRVESMSSNAVRISSKQVCIERKMTDERIRQSTNNCFH